MVREEFLIKHTTLLRMWRSTEKSLNINTGISAEQEPGSALHLKRVPDNNKLFPDDRREQHGTLAPFSKDKSLDFENQNSNVVWNAIDRHV